MANTRNHNYSTARRKMRKQLESWGMPQEDIDRCIRQVKERQNAKYNGTLEIDAPLCTMAVYVQYLKKQLGSDKKGTAVLRLGDDYVAPNDKGLKPTYVDPVLRGVARATGETAKAVKRKKTITKYQYDNPTNQKES